MTILSSSKSTPFSRGGVLRKRNLDTSNQKSFLTKVVEHPWFRGTGWHKNRDFLRVFTQLEAVKVWGGSSGRLSRPPAALSLASRVSLFHYKNVPQGPKFNWSLKKARPLCSKIFLQEAKRTKIGPFWPFPGLWSERDPAHVTRGKKLAQDRGVHKARTRRAPIFINIGGSWNCITRRKGEIVENLCLKIEIKFIYRFS